MAANETVPHGLKQYTDGTDKFPGRLGYNDMIDLLNRIPGCGVGPLSSRPLASSGLRFWVEEATGRLSVNLGDTWAGIADIGGTTTNAVIVGNESSEGSSSRAARGDHTHALPLATGTGAGAMSPTDKALLDTATAFPTGNALLKRDSAGRAQVAAPNLAGDAATKGYVDSGLAGKSATTHAHVAATPAAPGFMSAADKAKLDVIAVIGPWIAISLYTTHTASEYTPQYRVNSGRVELRGAIIKGTGNTAITATPTVPTSVKPAHPFTTAITHSTTLTFSHGNCGVINGAVNSDGVVYLGANAPASSLPAGTFIFLDGISWPI